MVKRQNPKSGISRQPRCNWRWPVTMRDKIGNSYVSQMVLSELAIDTTHRCLGKISCRGLRMPAASVNVTARNPEVMLSLGIVNLNILTGFLFTNIYKHAKWRAPMKSLMRT